MLILADVDLMLFYYYL